MRWVARPESRQSLWLRQREQEEKITPSDILSSKTMLDSKVLLGA